MLTPEGSFAPSYPTFDFAWRDPEVSRAVSKTDMGKVALSAPLLLSARLES